MPTPHNQAAEGQIASKILLPGDPLRAKYIAETYFDQPKLFTSVRNMFGYTGTYQNMPISVMGTGMGIPSMSIYVHELIHVFGVKQLIRVGSAGGINPKVQLMDIICPTGASTNSSFSKQYGVYGDLAGVASGKLLQAALKSGNKNNQNLQLGHTMSSDLFYHFDDNDWKKWANLGVDCLDMETYGLYVLAAQGGVDALAFLTISDCLVTQTGISVEQRQTGFDAMIQMALDTMVLAD